MDLVFLSKEYIIPTSRTSDKHTHTHTPKTMNADNIPNTFENNPVALQKSETLAQELYSEEYALGRSLRAAMSSAKTALPEDREELARMISDLDPFTYIVD